jgi:hypothetical protein
MMGLNRKIDQSQQNKMGSLSPLLITIMGALFKNGSISSQTIATLF